MFTLRAHRLQMGGIDVWIGPDNNQVLTGILCTFDTIKNDAKIKLMFGYSAADVKIIITFLDEMRTP
jgi:hypothetical protein